MQMNQDTPVSSGPRKTPGTLPVKDDLVTFHLESLRRHRIHPPEASEKVENPPALAAEEKMMMPTRRVLVVRGRAGDLDDTDTSVTHKPTDRTVNRGYSQLGQFLSRLFADLRRCQRPIRCLDHSADHKLLLRGVGHGTMMKSRRGRVNPRLNENPTAGGSV